MFDVVHALTVPPGCQAVASALRALDAFRAQIVLALIGLDRSGEWAAEGDTSLVAWLRRQGCSAGEAARLAGAARRLGALPVTAAAYAAGALTGAQVEAIVANLRGAHVPLFAEQEAELVPAFVPLSAEETATAMQAWREYADAVDEPPLARESELSVSRLPDGRRALRGDLTPRVGRLLEQALARATQKDAPGEPTRTPGERRADALADVCTFFLNHVDTPLGKRHRPHVHLRIDPTTHRCGMPGESLDGEPIDPVTTAVLLCDAEIRRVVMAGRSSVLDFGHQTRLVPRNLALAVAERDVHCRFPGCDRPPSWCDVHHIVDWYSGGPTVQGNLLLLCSRHHHLLHRLGWRIELGTDATVAFTDPEGTIRTTRPPPRIRGPAAALAA